MKFQNIQRFMWVNYNGEPWCVTMFHGTTIELISAYNKEIAFAQSFELEPLQSLPQFKVGDSVTYHKNLIGKMVTVRNVNNKDNAYAPYQVACGSDVEYVTPFDIVRLNY